jgi:hypothetical protein
MAVHRGPASLRPGCIQGGSPVAAVPIYHLPCIVEGTLFQGDSEGFRHHAAVTKFWALLAWLLADSLIVPFDTTLYAAFLRDSMNAVSKQYEKYVKTYAVQLESVVQNFTTEAQAFQYELLHADKSK